MLQNEKLEETINTSNSNELSLDNAAYIDIEDQPSSAEQDDQIIEEIQDNYATENVTQKTILPNNLPQQSNGTETEILLSEYNVPSVMDSSDLMDSLRATSALNNDYASYLDSTNGSAAYSPYDR